VNHKAPTRAAGSPIGREEDDTLVPWCEDVSDKVDPFSIDLVVLLTGTANPIIEGVSLKSSVLCRGGLQCLPKA
jgi:hypothetical protein